MFQSTFPQGERRGSFEVAKKLNAVSIHVPARGTTRWHGKTLLQGISFNPRSRKGNDFKIPNGDPAVVPFQSTFPQGERPVEGGFKVVKYEVSIHVPARGTTEILSLDFMTWKFQSTFPQGERRYDRRELCESRRSFNPRSRKGNDKRCRSTVLPWWSFNPRSRKGNDISH